MHKRHQRIHGGEHRPEDSEHGHAGDAVRHGAAGVAHGRPQRGNQQPGGGEDADVFEFGLSIQFIVCLLHLVSFKVRAT